MEKEIGPTSSYNIFTYQQINTKEEIEYKQPALEQVWKSVKTKAEKSYSLVEGCIFIFYEIHHAKFLYISTQNSKWNKKWYLFIQFKCKRDQGVTNNATHKYTFITNKDEIKYYNTFARKWEKDSLKLTNYTEKKHCIW